MATIMRRAVFLLLVLSSGARAAHAQAFSRLASGEQTVTTETGLESAIVTSLGYAVGLKAGALGTLMPFAQATLAVAQPDVHDYAFKTGAQADLLHAGWFDLSTRLAFEVAGTENTIYTGTALRSEVALLAGHYGRHWFALGEFVYDRAWLTYIKNSDWYRTYFYSGAKDGWYSGTGGTFEVGAKAGFAVKKVEIVLRAGITKSEALKSLDLPFYATLGANYRF
jgi:hypothetical protein